MLEALHTIASLNGKN